ncbi:hypothetical protein PINS_up011167 [Pythium insidiosum]|nr:hypothetical protein PINS_up011167 [Pythium insidiosum]
MPETDEVGDSESNGSRTNEFLFDVIDIGLSGIEVRLEQDIQEAAAADQLSFYLLDRTSVQLALHLSIAPDDPSIPLLKLIGGVDRVRFSLCHESYVMMMHLLQAILHDLSMSRTTDSVTSPSVAGFVSASVDQMADIFYDPSSISNVSPIAHLGDTFFSLKSGSPAENDETLRQEFDDSQLSPMS